MSSVGQVSFLHLMMSKKLPENVGGLKYVQVWKKLTFLKESIDNCAGLHASHLLHFTLSFFFFSLWHFSGAIFLSLRLFETTGMKDFVGTF